jgi:hypothetical protein
LPSETRGHCRSVPRPALPLTAAACELSVKPLRASQRGTWIGKQFPHVSPFGHGWSVAVQSLLRTKLHTRAPTPIPCGCAPARRERSVVRASVCLPLSPLSVGPIGSSRPPALSARCSIRYPATPCRGNQKVVCWSATPSHRSILGSWVRRTGV